MRVGSILIALIHCQTGSYASDFNYSKAEFLTVKDGAKSDPFIAESPDPMHTYRCSGREIDMPIGTPDIMPTLLGLSGIKVPDCVEGRDYSRVLTGEVAPNNDAELNSAPAKNTSSSGATRWMTAEPFAINGKGALMI